MGETNPAIAAIGHPAHQHADAVDPESGGDRPSLTAIRCLQRGIECLGLGLFGRTHRFSGVARRA